jgi:hypothetical protein
MKDFINEYLQSKQGSWADSTLRSEKARLQNVPLDGNPTNLYKHLQSLKPYTRCTTWTRVADFWQWMMDRGHRMGPNPYTSFRQSNSKQFKNAYTREVLDVTYEGALEAIRTLRPEFAQKAMELISSAQRWCECNQTGNIVVGKGGKIRQNLNESGTSFAHSYTTFYRELKKVGLKPHTLRKLALTRAVQNGATEFDLMAIAGWSSIGPASSYIQPRKKIELLNLLK